VSAVVTLYGRPGCHLCDEARDELLDLHRRGARFELVEVDIEGDEDLHRRMLESIPVVEIDGERVSELIFDPDAFLARLDTLSE
jgi:glutaredoxin